ncbi:chorismate-binding protein [Polaribacter sp.]|uniref:chorismate-binding protein n=1 Tax=Polaribacter sp. TaxID=1920175 RepID=UPI003F6A88DD
MIDIFNKLTNSYQNKLPFVAYRKPNIKNVACFLLPDDSLDFATNFNEEGFVFAPFNSDEKTVLFPMRKALFLLEKIQLDTIDFNDNPLEPDSSSKVKHIDIVAKAITAIKNSELKKVVISREEEVALSGLDIIEIYEKLLVSYNNAFVYVWYHPKVGLWFGATPETLLQAENNVFKTMSLAGTQLCKENTQPVWKRKELEEQQLVTDFIENQLQSIATSLKIDKTETVKAGNLLHLKTQVTGQLQTDASLKSLIRALHPTPAVCGLPRDTAKDFIIKNEDYNRSFYTGFLGELNFNTSKLATKKTALFVNLRCMSMANNKATIYVGGGITKDSVPEKEWQETVSKTQTIKKVL